MENKKKALGMGLEQLFSNESLNLSKMEEKIYKSTKQDDIVEVNLTELRPNPYQPRLNFDDEAINELAQSIKEHGVIQPIIIKKSIKGYEIVAGERRVRASQKIGNKTIPAIIREFTDSQMMEIALLENLQRENLSAIEEAKAYSSMLEKLNFTHDQLAKRVSKSRSHITNILGLLRLPEKVQEMINENKITMGHARVLSKLEDKEQIINIANKICDEKLPVRELERELGDKKYKKKVKIKRKSNNEYKYIENLLTEKLDAKIKICDNKITINFVNINDLKRILEILEVEDKI